MARTTAGPKPDTNTNVREIAKLLRERLPDIPLNLTRESGPWGVGINVYRLEREDHPSTASPWHGTAVQVMYSFDPQDRSEELWEERHAAVRDVLVSEYAERVRPIRPTGLAGRLLLIEDPDTPWSADRKADYEKRARLGWPPLHVIEIERGEIP